MADVEMDTSDLVFNPDQNPEEKRAVRQDYRKITRRIEERQANINDYSANDLIHEVQRANVLFDKVKGPQEATLDSHLLLMATNMGAQKARAMKSGSGAFDIDDFISKLVTFMRGTPSLEDRLPDDSESEDYVDPDAHLKWDLIGRRALAKSRRVALQGFMLGPLSIEQKKRGPIKRNKLEKNKEEEKKPMELTEDDISRSGNETTKNVAAIEQLLSQVPPSDEDGLGKINFFKFVINPNDFAQSVENIFHLSFLIRDGKAAFETVDGEPVIYTCETPGDDDYAAGLRKNQMILEFDIATWKKAIEVFNITESVIPQREKAQTRIGNQWYG